VSRYSGCGRLWGSRSAGLALAPHFVHDHLARVAHALGERAQAGRADTAGSESQGENAEDLCSTSVATDVEQTGEARWVRAAELVRWWGSLGAGEGPDDLVERWRSPACQRQAHPCPWDLEQLQGSPQQKRASEAVTECGEEHGSCARGWGDAGAAAFGRGPQPIDADDGEEWPARGSGRGWDAPACVLEDRIGALSGGGRAAAFAKHEQRAAGDVVVSHKSLALLRPTRACPVAHSHAQNMVAQVPASIRGELQGVFEQHNQDHVRLARGEDLLQRHVRGLLLHIALSPTHSPTRLPFLLFRPRPRRTVRTILRHHALPCHLLQLGFEKVVR